MSVSLLFKAVVTALPVCAGPVICAGLSGCAGTGSTTPAAKSPAAARPAPLVHLVYVKLKNPADAAALVADCDAMLATIPSVNSYFCGTHKESGRATVDANYDVAMGLGFADLAGYEAYVHAPAHESFVEKWKPRCEWIRIHDVEDATP